VADVAGLEFLDPVPPSVVAERPLAPRLAALGGRRLALLDNQKANAGDLLRHVGEHLARRHPDLELITERKAATEAAPEQVMEHLRTCDAVILAIAD
jgi:hypothetical protein